MLPNLSSSFWQRNGLGEECRDLCIIAIQSLYTNHDVEEIEHQGYCSFTLVVSRHRRSANPMPDLIDTSPSGESTVWHTLNKLVVQIRPEEHSLDLDIVRAAADTYGALTPRARRLDCDLPRGLRAFVMEKMDGVPFSRCQSRIRTLDSKGWEKQIRLLRSLASFVARAWPSSSNLNPAHACRRTRADSPMDHVEPTKILSQCRGKVGSDILPRLDRLSQELPDLNLRDRAASVLERMKELGDWPVVLNHGDLIPSNILIDPDTWKLKGVVDWAEAECLPFGACLYGLEHLLGYLHLSGFGYPSWVYYDRADDLRKVFWDTLRKELENRRVSVDAGFKEKVEVVRDMGVLLWYGYAWDEGRIDRVVNEEGDKDEVEMLRAFLNL